METSDARQDRLVEVRTMLPLSVRDELDRRARSEGLRRSTLIRVIVIRDVRRNGSPPA